MEATDHVTLKVETPDGSYMLEANHLVACDGARSEIRGLLGLDFDGELFEERFLIADIEMTGEFPSERRFWFEPPFHAGQSALLHKQPDNIYRIDLQLGWDADPEAERQSERVIPRIEKAVGRKDFGLHLSMPEAGEVRAWARGLLRRFGPCRQPLRRAGRQWRVAGR